MQKAFPGATINAPKVGGYAYGLTDPEDGHVAHAAIIGKADAIVTDDTRAGFKMSAILSEAGIEILHPHEFAANTVAAHPEAGVRALQAMSRRMKQPAQSEQEILTDLSERYGMNEVAKILGPELSRLAP